MLLDKLALILAIIGALNWGGIGLFGFDTVAFFCGGQMAVLARVIYALVGLAGIWCITLLFRNGEETTGHAPTQPEPKGKRTHTASFFFCLTAASSAPDPFAATRPRGYPAGPA